MKHISSEDLSELRNRLEEEKKVLNEELSRIGRRNPTNPADWEAVPAKMDIQEADRNEAADRIESYEENTAVLKELETRFNNVESALSRMDDNTYGICKVDNEPIEKDRLFANPAADTCMTHVHKEE